MFAKTYMLAGLVVLVVVGFATAGPCGVVTSKNVVAVNGYATNHVAVNHAVNYAQFVPIVQQVQVVPDFFYSSANYSRDEALLEALKLLRQDRASNGNNKHSPSVDDPINALLSGVPDIASKTGSGNSLQTVANTYCVRCHNGSNKNVDLTNLDTLSANVKKVVEEEVADGTMPPQGVLSKEQKRMFREWAYAK